MASEHASPQLISAYLRSAAALTTEEAWALEARLEGCAGCRGRLSALAHEAVPPVTSLLTEVWSGLEPRLTAPATSPVSRWRIARLPAWATPAMVP